MAELCTIPTVEEFVEVFAANSYGFKLTEHAAAEIAETAEKLIVLRRTELQSISDDVMERTLKYWTMVKDVCELRLFCINTSDREILALKKHHKCALRALSELKAIPVSQHSEDDHG